MAPSETNKKHLLEPENTSSDGETSKNPDSSPLARTSRAPVKGASAISKKDVASTSHIGPSLSPSFNPENWFAPLDWKKGHASVFKLPEGSRKPEEPAKPARLKRKRQDEASEDEGGNEGKGKGKGKKDSPARAAKKRKQAEKSGKGAEAANEARMRETKEDATLQAAEKKLVERKVKGKKAKTGAKVKPQRKGGKMTGAVEE